MAADGVTKSKDGVPQWNGDSRSFQEYEEMCLQWEQAAPYHKRYLCGPKLLGELSGAAKKHVVGKRPDWVSFAGGVEHLMNHLRERLGRPQIPELSDYLNKYFRQSRRRRFETMNDYITRKCELYSRARQALMRVQPNPQSRQSHWNRWQSPGWWSSRSSQHPTWDWSADQGRTREEQRTPRTASSQPEEDLQDAQDGEESGYGDPWSSYRTTYSDNEQWYDHGGELLPEFLQGWYLLMDAGLGTQERNMIQTAVGNDRSLERIARELRTQWREDDLQHHDQGQKQASFLMDHIDLEEQLENDDLAMTSQDLLRDGMSEEGVAMMAAAAEEAESALAAIEHAKRTLREARAKQHQIKLSRQYYKVSSTTDRAKTGGNTNTGIKCFRCGGNHKIANCPEKSRKAEQSNLTNIPEEEAPFVCYSEACENGDSYYLDEALTASTTEGKTTAQAIQAGYGIVDGGATRTIGSVHALEAIVEANEKRYKDGRILAVDPKNQPVFGFGNSSRDKCLSTTQLQIQANDKAGVLTVHTLDKGEGPVLLSIATLRSLKAVIDFEADLIVFRALDDRKLIKAERSQAGHQLLPLSADLYSASVPSNRPVPSLRDFCEH